MTLISAGFLWFTWLSDKINHHNIHVAHGLVVLAFLTVVSVLYKNALKSVDEEIIPDGKVSLKNILQMVVESLYSLFEKIIPHDTEKYFPVLGALFIYIFSSNLMGVMPGFLPPTENMSTIIVISLTVFLYYNFVGIKAQGIKSYLQHFMGPVLALAPIIFSIEIVSHCIRPISLSLRLFGNINGDHMVLGAFTGMAPLLVPVVFLAFGIFVAFMQAFVFTLLSAVYVGLGVEVHDHH